MVASKKLAPTKLAPRKSESRTILCWNATPLRFCPLKLELSRLTPRVMAMVRPDWRVDAPPVVILLLAARLAPWDGSSANADCGVRRGVVRSVKERRAVAAAEKRS